MIRKEKEKMKSDDARVRASKTKLPLAVVFVKKKIKKGQKNESIRIEADASTDGRKRTNRKARVPGDNFGDPGFDSPDATFAP